jgi:3-dehydroquinate dehydratase/shikimate dehydrogenase
MLAMTYLTVPISANNVDRAVEQITKAQKAGAEAIELRTDYLEGLNPALAKRLISGTRETCNLPLTVTCRDKKQGGCFDYPNELRVDVLTAAIEAGADFIDFEYDNFILQENRTRIESALEKNKKTRLILSAHNFKTRFEDINKLYSDIKDNCASAIPKLVYTAEHINDCFEGFDVLHKAKSDSIVFCMGEAGLISRVIAKKLGSLFTFASLNETSATAPGQLTIEEFKKLCRYDSINSETGLYGIIGSPIAHSMSPMVHNRLFAETGANKLYLPLLVEGGKSEFDEFFDGIMKRDWLDFRGFSVTIPHKQNAMEFVKTSGGFVEPLAEKIGAVNTIIKSQVTSQKSQVTRHKSQGTKLEAYNTDYAGAMNAIINGMKIGRDGLKNMEVTVIGAGGAARAVVAGLSDAGAKVKIYNRTIEKAKKLAAGFGCQFAGLDDLPNLRARLVINCTSIGMYPDVNKSVLAKEYINKDMVVFDTVYNPAETLLLQKAREVGAKTISGVDMFVSQAAEQFKLFTGKEADIEVIRKTISLK